MSAKASHGVVALVACMATGSARAAVPDPWGLYIGAEVAMTDFDAFRSGLDDLLGSPAAGSSDDSTHHGYSLAVGFRFSSYVAAEASWLDLGRARYRLDNGDANLKLGSHGPVVALIGNLPLNNTFSLEGRVGMYFYNSHPHGDVGIVVGDGQGGADPAGVLGASLVGALGQHWSVRLGYEYITDKAIDLTNSLTDDSLNTGAGRWLAGMRYRF